MFSEMSPVTNGKAALYRSWLVQPFSGEWYLASYVPDDGFDFRTREDFTKLDHSRSRAPVAYGIEHAPDG
jgi:hypothetical protein